jgi:hypothetical protein
VPTTPLRIGFRIAEKSGSVKKIFLSLFEKNYQIIGKLQILWYTFGGINKCKMRRKK